MKNQMLFYLRIFMFRRIFVGLVYFLWEIDIDVRAFRLTDRSL